MVYIFDEYFLQTYGAEESVFFCFVEEMIKESKIGVVSLTYKDINNATDISISKLQKISKMFQHEQLIKVTKKEIPCKTFYSFGENYRNDF